jgi:hypothetical protein
MSDKGKTKKQLIAELDALRRRVSELEHTFDGQQANDSDALPTEALPSEAPAAPDGEFDLSRLADAVSGTLRRMVPESCQLLLTAEERLGFVTEGPRPGEQIVVNLFHARV